jgi:hypothetical protein
LVAGSTLSSRTLVELTLNCNANCFPAGRIAGWLEHQAALRAGSILCCDLTINCRRPLSTELIEAVLQVDGSAGEVSEVNNDIHAFSRTNAHALDLNGVGQKVAVSANQPVRVCSAQISQIGEEELIEA